MAQLARRRGLHRHGDLKTITPRPGDHQSTGDAIMAFYELVLQGPNNLRRSLQYDPDTSRFIWADSNEPLDLSGFAGRRTPPKEWAHAFPVSPSNLSLIHI